jgi:glycosyltransferase involved in cell wall biosynthesis
MTFLSILIPTIPGREPFLEELQENIYNQKFLLQAQGVHVELLLDVRDVGTTTGEKRNDLLKRASGKYVWEIDEDDWIHGNALQLLYEASKTDPDVIGINGWMTTDGENRVDWEIRLGHEYKAIQRDGKEFYVRFPNHITPMKREHAIAVKFPHKTKGEDYEWALQIRDLGLLKTQAIVKEPIYHYRCRTK